MMTRSLVRLAAAGVVASLALAGCSSEEEPDASSASSTSADASKDASSSSSKSTDSSGDASSSDESSEASDKDAESQEPGSEQVRPADPAPLPGGDTPELPAAGAPALPSDEQEITGIVDGMKANLVNPYQYMDYVRENTCKANVDQAGGKEGYDQAAEGMVAMKRPLPKINGVRSVKVDGDRAIADVDATLEGVPQSPMKFQRENGRWAICS